MSDFAVPSHWQPKAGLAAPLSNCWIAEHGFTVAFTQRPTCKQFALIRPHDSIPFAYTSSVNDVPALIAADLKAKTEASGGRQ